MPRRVLLLTYTAAAGSGSEPGAGWGYVRAAAQHNDVTILIREEDADGLRASLQEAVTRHVRVIAVSLPQPMRQIAKRRGLHYAGYMLWSVKAGWIARQLETEADVAHHVTYGTDWLPSGLHLLRRTPVVWGPVGGYAPFPRRLTRYLGWRALMREIARFVITAALRRITMRLIRARTAMTVCANGDVARALARLSPLTVETQVALADALPPSIAGPAMLDSGFGARGRERTAVFVGRLQAWKGPYLALDAFSRLSEEWRLDIYGDGSERQRLAAAVARADLSSRVVFHGLAPREEVASALRGADVLLFPSMHDGSGFAVAEALSVGCPVVCLDVAGPSLLIQGENGIAVDPDGDAACQLAQAMLRVRRGEPSNRWHADRLTSVVDTWYSAAESQSANRSRASAVSNRQL
jgi:glycosyltransferase involved in cell wall biosynthesis